MATPTKQSVFRKESRGERRAKCFHKSPVVGQDSAQKTFLRQPRRVWTDKTGWRVNSERKRPSSAVINPSIGPQRSHCPPLRRQAPPQTPRWRKTLEKATQREGRGEAGLSDGKADSSPAPAPVTLIFAASKHGRRLSRPMRVRGPGLRAARCSGQERRGAEP
ncbi:hypothetical protein EYF80_029248 [Liparis tanakae]|uniref:Uncharacterized protein n=1 Tax=Liparis tanakae TaxID=230148 RepID=A0A4Z2H5G2_9TELE|nr:hypothetical protein EYF80_029248 [Liparis tanakae]